MTARIMRASRCCLLAAGLPIVASCAKPAAPPSVAVGDLDRTPLRTIAVALDAGIQGRVRADRIMAATLLVLRSRGYRPVVLPAGSRTFDAARAANADGLLAIVTELSWEEVAMYRGSPRYLARVDVPHADVSATLYRVHDGAPLIRGAFSKASIDVPPRESSQSLFIVRSDGHIDDEWTLLTRGLRTSLGALRPRESCTDDAIRRVRVVVAADEEHRLDDVWALRASEAIATASRMLCDEFGIALSVVGTSEWISSNTQTSVESHSQSMWRQTNVDSTDIVIGLTGQRVFAGSDGEVAVAASEPFGRAVLILPALVDEVSGELSHAVTGALIAQEVARLFGVPRTVAPTSQVIGERAVEWAERDRRAANVVALTRSRSFRPSAIGLLPLDSLTAAYAPYGTAARPYLDALDPPAR